MRSKWRPGSCVCLAMACAGLAMAACVRSDRFSSLPGSSVSASRRVIADGERVPKGGGSYKLGEPYQIDGQWYTPREDPTYDRIGVASFYAHDFHGRRTANGEVFDMWALSAAHPTLPLPSYVYVTNLENGRTLLVRVNDRGPYVNNRLIDLSLGSARYLGLEQRGLSRVRVRYAGPAPLSGDDRNEQRFLANQPWFRVALARGPYAAP